MEPETTEPHTPKPIFHTKPEHTHQNSDMGIGGFLHGKTLHALQRRRRRRRERSRREAAKEMDMEMIKDGKGEREEEEEDREEIERKVEALQRIVPGGEGLGVDKLFDETAGYIMALQYQVKSLKALNSFFQRLEKEKTMFGG